MRPRRPDEGDRVRLDLVGDADPADLVAEGEQPRPVEDRLDRVERLGRGLVAAGDPPLAGLVRIADPDPDEEPVELGLGQGERALELDRVLGREDDERVGQGTGRALDRDLALLHRLEQGRLGPRRGPVDLVDEEDVREDRPRREPERAALEEARAGDVDRQQVRRALDPVRLEVERPGDGPGEQRLAGARDVLDEDVAVGEERDRDEAERLLGADDRPPTAWPRSSQSRRPAATTSSGPSVAESRARLRIGLQAGGRPARRPSSSPASRSGRQASAARRRRTAGRIPPCSVVADVDRAVEAGDRLEPPLAPPSSRPAGDDRQPLPRREALGRGRGSCTSRGRSGPSDAALSPGRNWSGRTPIPTRFERWIRS